MITLNEKDFIGASIKSFIDWVDEIIIVDGGSTDGTLEVIDSFHSRKIKVIHNPWGGNFGEQRNIALSYATSQFCLQVDSDEILSDNGFALKDIIAKNPEIDCYDIEYVHYIQNLGQIDATCDPHIGLNRLFRRTSDVAYTAHLHELAHSPQWKPQKGFIRDVKLHHLGYIKSILSVSQKYIMNLEKKSPIHTKEYLVNWRNSHVFGAYPVKKIDPNTWQYPTPLLELFALNR